MTSAASPDTAERQPGESQSGPGRSTRREVVPPLGAAGAAALAALAPVSRAQAQSEAEARAEAARRGVPDRFVYVGTYTKPNTAPGGEKPSEALGLYVFRMDGRSGALTPVQLVENLSNVPGLPNPSLPNPSWVTLDPTLRYLYASSEVGSWRGQANNGGLTAFSVDASTGKLTRLNDQPSSGAIPASITTDPNGRYLLTGNYVGVPPKGTFAVNPIQAGGALGGATDVVFVEGSGPNLGRQEAPHPHDVKFDPAGKFVAGVDLGTDKVWVWSLDLASGKLIAAKPPYAQVASGSGCRHMAFHPSGKWAYVINELVSSVTAFSYDPARGAFTWIQTLSTLPSRFSGSNSTAEIVVHPTGKWVYGSNRGHNTIVVYEVDAETGKLEAVEWQSTEGKVPRGFNIDPSGTLLLAGNQNSDTIVPFRINQITGRLRPTGEVTSTPTPVCIQFGPVALPL